MLSQQEISNLAGEGTACPIKVASVALDSEIGDVEGNLRQAEALLSALDRDTDIAVLPELFNTGFVQNPVRLSQLAAEHGEKTIRTAMHWARKYDIAVCGSCLYREGDIVFNRGFFITPDEGVQAFYDKHHLFCLSPEAKYLTKGSDLPPVIQYKRWNISMIICYDLRFPVWCRNLDQRYDMLLVPANWPQARAYAWRHLLIARAIENQAVVIGANRSGHDEFGEYNDNSYIIDPSGMVVAPSCDTKETSRFPQENAVIYASFTLAQVQKIRTRLPVGADADPFSLTVR